MRLPDTGLELRLSQAGHTRIAGVDEVGRGPWAGPVVAAAVILDLDGFPDGLNDSKKLTRRARTDLADSLRDCADIGLGAADVGEIDRLNILQASYLAMTRAVADLASPPDYILIDGRGVPSGLPCPAMPVVKGDGRSVSIAAASIVAKVWRDRHMAALAQQHPGYGWERNAGYGTFEHRSALTHLGITPHHRRSFKPIHKMLYQEK